MPQNSCDGTGGWGLTKHTKGAKSEPPPKLDPSQFNRNYLKSGYTKQTPSIPHNLTSKIPPPREECDVWGHHTALTNTLQGVNAAKFNSTYLKGDLKQQFRSPAPRSTSSGEVPEQPPISDMSEKLAKLIEHAKFLTQYIPKEETRLEGNATVVFIVS